jgi:ferritin-like metal-binding protein YciE
MFKMSEEKTIHDLFVEELQDIYHAEKQLTKALPKMAKKASNQELKDGIAEHLEETYRQCERLEQIFDHLGMRSKAKPCEAMRGLIEEASEIMREDMPPEVMDVAIVSCSQKVEHYEIASYGTLVALAQAMGHDAIVSLLQETLEEEKHTDEKLTELATSEINPAAMQTLQASSKKSGREEGPYGSYGKGRRERYAELQRAADNPTSARAPAAKGRKKSAKGRGRPKSATKPAGKTGAARGRPRKVAGRSRRAVAAE